MTIEKCGISEQIMEYRANSISWSLTIEDNLNVGVIVKCHRTRC